MTALWISVVDWSLRGVAGVLLVWLVLAVFRRWPSGRRSSALLLALSMPLLVAVGTGLPVRVRLLPADIHDLMGSVESAGGLGHEVRPEPPVPQADRAADQPPPIRAGVASWLVWVWLGGVAAATAIWLLGTVSLRRLLRRCRDAPPDLAALAAECLEQMPRRRAARVLTDPSQRSPMTWGWLRPRIIVPAAIAGWPRDWQRAALLHESAHVRNFDCLRMDAARALLALQWFNPIAWIVYRRFVTWTERAADDEVVGAGVAPSAYAALMLAVAGATSTTADGLVASTMATPSRLEGRLYRVLNVDRRRGQVGRVSLLSALGATAVTAVAVGTLDVRHESVGSWRNVSTAVSPDPRFKTALVFDEARGRTLMFGGWSSILTDNEWNSGFRGDTWVWDGLRWTRSDAHGPSPRDGHGMVFDRDRGVVVLFGGEDPDPLGDTWEWDGSNWSRVAAEGPSPRWGFGMAYDARRGVTVLFGGDGQENDGEQRLGDTWEWDGSVWRLRSTKGPPARGSCAMVFDERRAVVVLFGGEDGRRPFGDTWEWDGVAWRRRDARGPAPRWSAAAVYAADAGCTLVFGGALDAAHYANDTWSFDGVTWRRVAVGSPDGRVGVEHALAWDGRLSRGVLFGGYVGPACSETWELTISP